MAIDPRLFEFKQEGSTYDENNSLRFKLHVECTKKNPNEKAQLNNTEDEEKLYNHPNVYSGDFQWIPIGSQAERFKDLPKPRPLLDDILIAKLRPG